MSESPREDLGVPGLNRLEFDDQGVLHVDIAEGAVVLARVMSGYDDSAFENLQWPGKRTAFVMDETSLRALNGKGAVDCLYQIGFLPDAVQQDIVNGRKYKLLVFQPDESNGAVVANYSNCVGVVSKMFPQVALYLQTALPMLQQYAGVDGLGELEAGAFSAGILTQDLTTIFKANENAPHPEFMTVDRFIERVSGLDISSKEGSFQLCVLARMFLYHTVGLFRLYAGDGYGRVKTPDGVGMGSPEYFLPNTSVASLGAKVMLDFPMNK